MMYESFNTIRDVHETVWLKWCWIIRQFRLTTCREPCRERVKRTFHFHFVSTTTMPSKSPTSCSTIVLTNTFHFIHNNPYTKWIRSGWYGRSGTDSKSWKKRLGCTSGCFVVESIYVVRIPCFKCCRNRTETNTNTITNTDIKNGHIVKIPTSCMSITILYSLELTIAIAFMQIRSFKRSGNIGEV